MVKAMFNVLVTVHVRDGAKALFWSDRWMDSSLVGSLAPLVVAAVQPRVRKTRLVADGLQNMRWLPIRLRFDSVRNPQQNVGCAAEWGALTNSCGNGHQTGNTQGPTGHSSMVTWSVQYCRGQGTFQGKSSSSLQFFLLTCSLWAVLDVKKIAATQSAEQWRVCSMFPSFRNHPTLVAQLLL
jgi:hypothetical protein